MDEPRILDLMQAYIDRHMRDVALDGPLAQTPVASVFRASIDIVDFIMYMEESLELTEEINLERLGPKFAQEQTTFAELAAEIKRYLETLR
jgi:hypothetical protein